MLVQLDSHLVGHDENAVGITVIACTRANWTQTGLGRFANAPQFTANGFDAEVGQHKCTTQVLKQDR